MSRARRILKHAELHILRDFGLWCADARAWSESQELLRRLRYSLPNNNVRDALMTLEVQIMGA